MSNDDIKRILAAIEELRSENALAHRGLDAKIEDVRKTQGDHTVSLKLISEFTGVLPHIIGEIAKKVGIHETGLSSKIIELSRKAEAAKL